MDVGRMLGTVTAVFALAAGVLHLSAAGDHTDHEFAVVFFIAAAAFQLGWAGGTLMGRDGRAWLAAGAVGNVAIAGVWVVSRTAGVPFVPEVNGVEAVGVKDTITTLLEVLAAGGAAVLLALPEQARRAALISGTRAVAAVTAGVFVVSVPGMLAAHGAGHEHGAVAAAHGHTADGHGHTDDGVHDVAAAGHAHAATQVVHGEHAATSTSGAAHDHGKATAGSTAHQAHAAHDQHDTAPVQTQAASTPRPAVDPDTLGRRAVVRYPILLMPVGLGGAAHRNLIIPTLPKPCENCFITWMKPDLTLHDGTTANLDRGLMLHHTVLAQPDREDPTCPRNTGLGLIGERFFAAGNERTVLTLPAGYGYRVGTMPWVGVFEIMNHSPSMRLVFFELEVRYQPASANLKPVTPLWLDMDNCGDSAYAIPAGRTTGTWRWTSNLTGRVVAAGGHVHDGGIAITTMNKTTGQRMCRSSAGYGAKPAYMGTIDSMSTCIWDRIGTVRAGDTVELITDYNSSIAQPDVMGIVIAYLYKTNDLLGGSPAPPDVVDASSGESAAPPPVHKH